MNRRTSIKAILGIVGLSYASVIGVKYFKGDSNLIRGKLQAHLKLITELVEIIIPTTTLSPGAKAAQVQHYIIGYMEDCSTIKEYNNFLNGLNELQENSKNTYSCNFENCSLTQKQQQLEDLDNNFFSKGLLLKINNKLHGRSFFNLLKTVTIEGYCTSFIGATQHLEYVLIPGKYNAITKLSRSQKSWATK